MPDQSTQTDNFIEGPREYVEYEGQSFPTVVHWDNEPEDSDPIEFAYHAFVILVGRNPKEHHEGPNRAFIAATITQFTVTQDVRWQETTTDTPRRQFRYLIIPSPAGVISIRIRRVVYEEGTPVRNYADRVFLGHFSESQDRH